MLEFGKRNNIPSVRMSSGITFDVAKVSFRDRYEPRKSVKSFLVESKVATEERIVRHHSERGTIYPSTFVADYSHCLSALGNGFVGTALRYSPRAVISY